MDENWAILNHSTDENGHKFKIIPMPAPEALYEMMGSGDSTYDYISQLKFEDGTTFVPGQKVKGIMAASYMNYLVTNDVVLLPKYWKPGRSLKIKLKDEQARLALQQAFPERQIIQIDPENVNVGGGGMHCITHDQPK
jgi:agmatine deiminase